MNQLRIQDKKLKSHLAPSGMLPRTTKGCEHPWLGNPALTIRYKSPKTIRLFFFNYLFYCSSPLLLLLLNHKYLVALRINRKKNPENTRATSREKKHKLRNWPTKILEETRFTKSLWNLLCHKQL